MPLRFEREEWPLVRLRWPEGALLDSDLDVFERESEADLAHPDVHCILHLSDSKIGLSPAQRKRMADFLAQKEVKIRRATSGVAIVTPSAIIRGMITAVSWLTGTPCPQRTFSNELEARAWLAETYTAKTGQPARFASASQSRSG